MNKLTIQAALIVKDEEKILEKCLESIKDFDLSPVGRYRFHR